jgi:hypothetical protein
VFPSDLPGVNPATLNEILPYYHLMTKWSGLGDSTELSRVGLSQNPNRTRASVGGSSQGGHSAGGAGGSRAVVAHGVTGGGGSGGGSSSHGAGRRAGGGGDRGG